MCHADISLSGSQEYVSFNNHTEGQKCRDLGALQRWATAHSWLGYRDYLKNVVGFDGRQAELAVEAVAGEGQWHKSHSSFNKKTHQVKIWYEEE